MIVLVLGLLLLLLKLCAIAPVAQWSWGLILMPFGLTLLWWLVSDVTGRTARKARRREEEKAQQRRKRVRQQLDSASKRRRF
jgi:small Trp-rich protein